MTGRHYFPLQSNQKPPSIVLHPTFQISLMPGKVMGLAGGLFSLLLHFHPQSQDGASMPKSPRKIMEKANNGPARINTTAFYWWLGESCGAANLCTALQRRSLHHRSLYWATCLCDPLIDKARRRQTNIIAEVTSLTTSPNIHQIFIRKIAELSLGRTVGWLVSVPACLSLAACRSAEGMH